MATSVVWSGKAGKYVVKGVEFLQGMTVLVTDPELLAKIKATGGFTVLAADAPPPPPPKAKEGFREPTKPEEPPKEPAKSSRP